MVASKERAFTPESLRAAGKPTLFAQAGIHAGEIDGKDAGMMLLRDLSVGGSKSALLDRANFLFVPIYNVDGHERFSAFTRINQRGPKEAGWRTTARNLNLNRDYTKLDARETRLLVRALTTWPVDLYYDLHVTDDTDHQYDMTYGHNWPINWSPAISTWLEKTLLPATDADLRAQGHIPGRHVQLIDHQDPGKGLLPWFGGPRFSNGWGDARHLPSILVEAHSLKPFAQRVLANYVLLESTLRVLGEKGEELRRAVREDQERRTPELVLDWKTPAAPPRTVEVQAVEWRASRLDSLRGDPHRVHGDTEDVDRAQAGRERPRGHRTKAPRVLGAGGVERGDRAARAPGNSRRTSTGRASGGRPDVPHPRAQARHRAFRRPGGGDRPLSKRSVDPRPSPRARCGYPRISP